MRKTYFKSSFYLACRRISRFIEESFDLLSPEFSSLLSIVLSMATATMEARGKILF